MALQLKKAYDATALLASGARAATAGTTTSATPLPGMVNGMQFTLDVTAAATDANDTLDVAVQTMIDGTNWIDVVAFTQCVGNGGALRYIAKVTADGAQAVGTAAALAAGNLRNIIGDTWRVSYVIVDPAGANASFTFSVWACPC